MLLWGMVIILPVLRLRMGLVAYYFVMKVILAIAYLFYVSMELGECKDQFAQVHISL